MFTDTHYFSHKFLFRITPAIRHILEKVAILLVPLPLFMLFSGTTGIIENESPEHLATIGSMGSSFFNSFGMHSLILAGAFGITFIIWLITRNVWDQFDEEIADEFSQSGHEQTLNNENTLEARETTTNSPPSD